MESEELKKVSPINKKLKYLATGLIGIAVLLFLAYFLKDLPFGEIEPDKLIITGHKKLRKEEIIEYSGIKGDQSLGKYDLSKVEENLKKHIRIKEVSVIRRSKHQILINVVEKNSVYIVNSNDVLHELDEDLNLVSFNEVKDISTVIISGDFGVGHKFKVNARLRELIDSINLTFEIYPLLKNRISEFVLSSDGEIVIYIFLPKRFKVLVGETLNLKQIRKLYATLAYFENQGISINLLDLRGEDAVYH